MRHYCAKSIIWEIIISNASYSYASWSANHLSLIIEKHGRGGRREAFILQNHLYTKALLTSLFPLVFAAAWYFPKLSAFLTACSPLLLHCFPRRFKQAKLPLLLLFNFLAALQLVWRGQLSKQQRDNRDCLFTLLLSEVTKDGMGGERTHVHRQDSCTLEMNASSRSAYV